MLSMCGLLCRFIRGWRQSEAVGAMINAAMIKHASLLVEKKHCQNNQDNSSGFCQPNVSTETKHLLWQDNNKHAKMIFPKETIDLKQWTLFLDTDHLSECDNHSECKQNHAKANNLEPDIKNTDYASQNLQTSSISAEHTSSDSCRPGLGLSASLNSSRRTSLCSNCENEITVLLEASYAVKDENISGYYVLVEHLSKPYAWKTRDNFGVLVRTTPANLISMVHAFFNNALMVDDDLLISKILTVDMVGEPLNLLDPSSISESKTKDLIVGVIPGTAQTCMSPSNGCDLNKLEILPSSNEREEKDTTDGCSTKLPEDDFSLKSDDEAATSHLFHSPQTSLLGSPVGRGSPFNSSPFRRTGPSASGMSPVKRVFSTHKSATTPDGEASTVCTVVEEDENQLDSEEGDVDSKLKSGLNVLIYTGSNTDYFESVKKSLELVLERDRYVIYNLSEEKVLKWPWESNAALLVLCGDVATHACTQFIKFLLNGGKVLSICSNFLNVAIPLFGTVEVQEASILSLNFKKWKNVQLLHHKHCLHSSPKKQSETLLKENDSKNSSYSNTGAAVSVEPTHVEITDESGLTHRLDLQILAKDNTWKFPAIFSASGSQNSGKAIFSQVHLEEEMKESFSYLLTRTQLEKYNSDRLAILGDLLNSHLSISVIDNTPDNDQETLAYTPAYVLADSQMRDLVFSGKSQTAGPPRIVFVSADADRSLYAADERFLPIFQVGCPKTFSTVKYFECLGTKHLGRVLIHSEVLTSTMDVIKSSPPLGHGIAVVCDRQTKGKGRGGNYWLSPKGAVMFSIQLHLDTTSRLAGSLPFAQHIMSVSVVSAVKRLTGYGGLPLKLKWPNDIYLGHEHKLGGVLVEASTSKRNVVLNVGIGLNLANSRPTACLNDAIRSYNLVNGTELAYLCPEDLLAHIFNRIEANLDEYETFGPRNIVEEYYRHWLHGNSRVSVLGESGESKTVTIVGIDDFGFLEGVSDDGERLVLHPDGNSFDMLRGLIYLKLPPQQEN